MWQVYRNICTWSRKRAVWCEPGWKHAAPPLLLSLRCCWSAEPNGAPRIRCTAHTVWGGSASPPPNRVMMVIFKWFFFKKKEKVYFLICTKWERTTPPLRSSDHSLGGGCRSPADSGDASTVSAFAPCPGRAVWWRATYAHTKPHAVLKANDKQTKCLTLSWGGSHWGSPCQTKLQSSYSSRRFSSLDPPPFPRRLHSQQCTGTHQTVDTKYPNKCGFAPSEWMSWKIKWRRLSSALWFL